MRPSPSVVHGAQRMLANEKKTRWGWGWGGGLQEPPGVIQKGHARHSTTMAGIRRWEVTSTGQG